MEEVEDFLRGVDFVIDFFITGVFLVTVFLMTDFLVAVFLLTVFLAVVFLARDFFVTGFFVTTAFARFVVKRCFFLADVFLPNAGSLHVQALPLPLERRPVALLAHGRVNN